MELSGKGADPSSQASGVGPGKLTRLMRTWRGGMRHQVWDKTITDTPEMSSPSVKTDRLRRGGWNVVITQRTQSRQRSHSARIQTATTQCKNTAAITHDKNIGNHHTGHCDCIVRKQSKTAGYFSPP